MEESICSQCHIAVRPTDYFCFNCGKNLHPKPPGTTPSDQAMLYLGSIFLPPMGIIWGMRYLKFPDVKVRIVGWVAIFITVIVLTLTMIATVRVINSINDQVGKQMQGMYGF